MHKNKKNKISQQLKEKSLKIIVILVTLITIVGMGEYWIAKQMDLDIEQGAKDLLGIETDKKESEEKKTTQDLVNTDLNKQSEIVAKDGKINVLKTSENWIMYNNKIYQLCSGSYYESKEDKSDIEIFDKIKKYDSTLKTGEDIAYTELSSNTVKKETQLYKIKENENYLLMKIEDTDTDNQYVIYMDQTPKYMNFNDMLKNKENIVSGTYIRYSTEAQNSVEKISVDVKEAGSLDADRILKATEIAEPSNTITGYLFVKMDNSITTSFIMQETKDEKTGEEVTRLIDLYDSKVYILTGIKK